MNLTTKQCWLLISGIFYIIQINNNNNYTHGFPKTSSRTLSFILPLEVFILNVEKCNFCCLCRFVIIIIVDVAASGNVTTTCFLFSKMEERIKLKCRCGGSQRKLSFVQRCLSTSSQLSVLCVFIAYKDYQYSPSTHVYVYMFFT